MPEEPTILTHVSDLHLAGPHPDLDKEILSRLEDAIDFAKTRSDLFILTGSIFAGPPKQALQAELVRLLKRLRRAGITALALPGPGDLDLGFLQEAGVLVSSLPSFYKLSTHSGKWLFLTTCPYLNPLEWLHRRPLPYTDARQREEAVALDRVEWIQSSARMAGELMQEGEMLPSLLVAHGELAPAGSRPGALPADTFEGVHFTYMALAGARDAQVGSRAPLGLYPGSLAHLDFADWQDDKGWLEITLSPSESRATFHTHHRRGPARPMRRIVADVRGRPTPTRAAAGLIRKMNLGRALVHLTVVVDPGREAEVDRNYLKGRLEEECWRALAVQVTTGYTPELSGADGVTQAYALERLHKEVDSGESSARARRLLGGQKKK